jgi:hypothetical protein
LPVSGSVSSILPYISSGVRTSVIRPRRKVKPRWRPLTSNSLSQALNDTEIVLSHEQWDRGCIKT